MAAVVRYINLKYYQYELALALYMLEPWEKILFNTLMLVILGFAVYTTVTFGPGYISAFIFSLLDYFPWLDTAIPGVQLSHAAQVLASITFTPSS